MNDMDIYEFGSKVYCTDAACGELRQFIVDPATSRVTELVVRSPTDGEHLVPISVAQPAGPETIALDCGHRAFVDFPAPGIKNRSVAVAVGDRVRATDGNAGHVEGLAVRSDTGKIGQVLVAAGPWWHRRHVAVPAAVVPGFGPGTVRVLMTKQQVKDLASAGMRRGSGPAGPGPDHPGSRPSITHP